MKRQYVAIMVVLIGVAIVFEWFVFTRPLGQDPRLANAIQSASIFAALLAIVVALSATDPKRKRVKATIEPTLAKASMHEHSKSELPDEIKVHYRHAPDLIRSYQVHFRITNASGFTLQRPTLTFRLPVEKQHPHQVNGAYTRSFNSNLFNSQSELKVLELANTLILSNSNLPYWNHRDDVTIWIRMMLNEGDTKPFDIEVSLNSENADGLTEKVTLQPTELLR